MLRWEDAVNASINCSWMWKRRNWGEDKMVDAVNAETICFAHACVFSWASLKLYAKFNVKMPNVGISSSVFEPIRWLLKPFNGKSFRKWLTDSIGTSTCQDLENVRNIHLQIHFLYCCFLRYFGGRMLARSYCIKYSYLIQIICTQLCGFK